MVLPVTIYIINRPACFAPLPNDVIALIFTFLGSQTSSIRLTCRFFRKFNLHPFLTIIPRQYLSVQEQIEATLPYQQKWVVVTSTFVIITGSEESRKVPLPTRLDLNRRARVVKNNLFVLSEKLAYHLDLTTFVLRKISTKRTYIYSEPNSDGNIAYSDNGNQIFIKSNFSKSILEADWLPQLKITQLALLENNNLLICNKHQHSRQLSLIQIPFTSIVKSNDKLSERFFQHSNFLITSIYSPDLSKLVSLDSQLEIISEISLSRESGGMDPLEMQKVGEDLFFLLADRSIARIRMDITGNLRLLCHFRTNFNINWFRNWYCHDKGIFILSLKKDRDQIEFWSFEGDFRGSMLLNGSVRPTSIAYNGAELLVGYANGTIKSWTTE